jgi:sugar phosphate isomerase/epimerase
MSAADGAAPLARLSLNQITVDQWTLPEVVDGCVRARIGTIAPWREPVAKVGLDAAARLIADAGLSVSSLCRGGFFPAADAAGRRAADEDNRRAVEEAATLGTDVLVLVCGPPIGRDVEAARAQILGGIERLVPHAEEHGVRLAIEPLHPMMISERSAIVTLGEANDLAERFDDTRVGVVVDAYHVWWDPRLYEEIARAGRRILGYHVADWLVPTTDRLQGRGMMGTGVIDLKRIRAAVEEAGYDGPIEVEVINRDAWDRPGDDIVAEACEAFLTAA